jgi:peptidoglycan/LPS O-acetylase OafA/YrhL
VGIVAAVIRPRARRRRSLARGLSGVLVGGLVALALVLVGGWFYADRIGLPGPGLAVLVGHGAAAVAAVAAQVWVDRRSDGRGTLAAAALAALVVGGLALTWLF